MKIHCDSCGDTLGTYLYGLGGVEEKALILGEYSHGLPDIVCKVCWKEGFSLENPKDPIKVYGKEYKKYPPNIDTPIITSLEDL